MARTSSGSIDLDTVQAVQTSMIGHCESDGRSDRDLGPTAGLQRPADQGVAGREGRYDSAYAALYWPWVKMMTRTGVAGPGAAVRALAGDLGPQRRHVAASTRRRPTRCARGDRPRSQHHHERAGSAEPRGHQRDPDLLGPWHPRLGRAHPVLRSGLALPQRPAAVQLPGGVDPRGHQLGRLRAQRPGAVGQDPPHDRGVSGRCVARRRLVRHHSGRGVLRASATPRPTRPRRSTSARCSARSAWPRSSRPSSSSSGWPSSPAAPAWSASSPYHRTIGVDHGNSRPATRVSDTRSDWSSTASRSRASTR